MNKVKKKKGLRDCEKYFLSSSFFYKGLQTALKKYKTLIFLKLYQWNCVENSLYQCSYIDFVRNTIYYTLPYVRIFENFFRYTPIMTPRNQYNPKLKTLCIYLPFFL